MENKNDIPTRDITTKKLYLKRVIGFIKRAYKEALEENHEITKVSPFVHSFGEDKVEGLNLLNTTIWVCKNWSKNLTQESWRSYRAPLKFIAEIYLQMELIDEKSFNRINSVLDNTKGVPKKELEERTSRKKQKHLSIKDLKKVDNELSNSKSIWSKPTRIWLRAGILTGLRPIEWRKSELIRENNGSLFLKVLNAKNSNNRANGEYRHLNLDHLDSNEIKIIKSHLKICENFSDTRDEWDSFYKGCSNLLRTKTRIAFPNRKRYPTLYSSRHQFSANSKASGCRPEEIAALMGHASDLTAQMTYGKKINGTRGRKPKIKNDEVKSVRKHKKTMKYFSFDNGIKNTNKNTSGQTNHNPSVNKTKK